jgi:hypothetical protein
MSELLKPLSVGALSMCAVLLFGCSSTYEEIASTSETQWIKPDVLVISISGNNYTSHQKIREFAYLRAADIGLEKGYSYFAIESVSNPNVTIATTECSKAAHHHLYSVELDTDCSTEELKVRTLNNPGRRVVVKLLSDQSKYVGRSKIYDAISVHNDLGRKYKIEFDPVTPK